MDKVVLRQLEHALVSEEASCAAIDAEVVDMAMVHAEALAGRHVNATEDFSK